MATYHTFRNGLPARVSRQFEEEYEQPIKYQVSSSQYEKIDFIDWETQWKQKRKKIILWFVGHTLSGRSIPFIFLVHHPHIERVHTSQVQ